jgi:hypothetical protein
MHTSFGLKAEEKIPLERRRYRYEGNIKTDLKETGSGGTN